MLLTQQIERRHLDCAGVLFVVQQIDETVRDAAFGHVRRVIRRDAALLQHFFQHEGKACGHGIDRQCLAAQIGEALIAALRE